MATPIQITTLPVWPLTFLEDAVVYISALFTPWFAAFCVLWLHRYVRLIVHCYSHWTYKSKPIPNKPSYTSDDVTVVIPTIHDNFDELRPSLESILATKPHELIMVTTANKFEDLQRVVKTLSSSNIRIFCTQYANKRIQVCEALPKITTRITIMADDDVTWPSTMMPWILAPFEDPKIGGVGTCQRVKRVREGGLALSIWNWLGAAYIERRNFEISATHNMDGGTSCMSGRTGAYRSEILRDYEFLEGFMKEEWWGKILKADDDNFVSRWLVSHQWKTWIQYDQECELETTLENNHKFLYQCSRWARSNWRSNWTSLVKERYVWKQQWWCTYALHIATFTSLAFVFDFLILAALWWGAEDWKPVNRTRALYAQLAFLAFSKVVKLVGLFRRHPADIMFLPVSIVFGYFHGLIKIYAGLTLNMTSWGSRTDGDTDDAHRLAPGPVRCSSLNTPRSEQKLPHYVQEHEFINEKQQMREEEWEHL
ncbi:hypothetical protein PpBr36_00686 [Pyricularia pennisetigena]|uniref:hypothetical protein n=1 Tax=Pyricularia pennisetigena TaxID=1578925 RepID=UPI001152E61E|nr:hypothetical protein PpBr36_00686 [Pyricularia pennisetigena]TLS27846.1 hypothetical protein PpBr36_00686 [Pyricularia pennisetigena]